MNRTATLALCAALATGGAARAENAFDLVFKAGTLDGLSLGAELLYDGEGTASLQARDNWDEVVVGLGPDDSANVVGRLDEQAGSALPLGRFNAKIGNPVAMVFLERTVLTISHATGGSPFYIRNRIRDALAGPGEVEAVSVDWNGETVQATQIALVPFRDDAHRADLGVFADLVIRVVVSEAVPGWYHSIRAEAPATPTQEPYAASLALAGVEE